MWFVEMDCRFCGGEAESDTHVFWWCPKAVEVWGLTDWWERIERFKGIPCYDVLGGLFPLLFRGELEGVCMVLWGLWFNRNASLNKGVVRSAEDLLSWVYSLLLEWGDKLLNHMNKLVVFNCHIIISLNFQIY
ncbi:hypothetical protein ACOSQ4_006388 [Xanthoceras sorbifolium]